MREINKTRTFSFVLLGLVLVMVFAPSVINAMADDPTFLYGEEGVKWIRIHVEGDECHENCVCLRWRCFPPDRPNHRKCWSCRRWGCPVLVKEMTVFGNWVDSIIGTDMPLEGIGYQIWANSETILVAEGVFDATGLVSFYVLTDYTDLYIKLDEDSDFGIPRYQGAIPILEGGTHEVELQGTTEIVSDFYFSHDMSSAVNYTVALWYNGVYHSDVMTDSLGTLTLQDMPSGLFQIFDNGDLLINFTSNGFESYVLDTIITIESIKGASIFYFKHRYEPSWALGGGKNIMTSIEDRQKKPKETFEYILMIRL